MKFFLVSNLGMEDSRAIIAAETEKEARYTAPDEYHIFREGIGWCSPEGKFDRRFTRAYGPNPEDFLVEEIEPSEKGQVIFWNGFDY